MKNSLANSEYQKIALWSMCGMWPGSMGKVTKAQKTTGEEWHFCSWRKIQTFQRDEQYHHHIHWLNEQYSKMVSQQNQKSKPKCEPSKFKIKTAILVNMSMLVWNWSSGHPKQNSWQQTSTASILSLKNWPELWIQ